PGGGQGLNGMDGAAAELAQRLTDARAQTLAIVAGLRREQLLGPYLPIVNPPLWELGHLAWFQGRWALRELRGEGPLWQEADALYDPARVPHRSRWELPLPDLQRTFEYMRRVMDRVLGHLLASAQHGTGSEKEAYFYRLVTFHEDMHGEAFVYTRQTLGYPP